MGAPSGQDTVLSAQTSLTLLYSGPYDPSVTSTLAVAGTLFLCTGGATAGQLFIKQDNGDTTNWSVVGGGGGSVVPGYFQTMIFVDGNNANVYVPDGSISKPYKTIQAGINAAAARNSEFSPIEINIAPGNYPENVVVNSPTIFSLILNGNNGVTISPAAGNAFESSANNNQIIGLTIKGIAFNGPILVQGDINNTLAFQQGLTFYECTTFFPITFTNFVTFSFFECELVSDLIINNVASGGISVQLRGNLSATYNPLTNNPVGSSPANFYVLENCVLVGDISVNNCEVQTRLGSRVVNPGHTATVNNGGLFRMYASYCRGNIVVNSGGTFTQAGSFFTKANLTVNVGGVYNNQTEGDVVLYVPSVPGDWAAPAPSDLNSAINRLAAAVFALNGGVPIP